VMLLMCWIVDRRNDRRKKNMGWYETPEYGWYGLLCWLYRVRMMRSADVA